MTGATRVYAPVPGPVDRVSFLDEQARNRRESWRFSLLALLGVLVTGLPLCVMITPLVLGFGLLVAHLVQLVAPLPQGLWLALEALALTLPIAFGLATHQLAQMPMSAHMRDVLGRVAPLLTDAGGSLTPAAVGALVALLVLPGSVALLVGWLWIRRALPAASTAALLRKLGAREPRPGDFEEHQVKNLVEEIAVACVVPPPRVLIVDAPGGAANAAAFGLSLDDATVVVTRGLLDQLDRDETQAILAHAVASVGNGDMKILSTIMALFQAWGLAVLVLGAPVGSRSRRALRRLLKVALLGQRTPARRQEAEAVAELLFRGTETDGRDDLDELLEPEPTPLNMLRTIPLLLSFGAGSFGGKIWVQVQGTTLFGGVLTKLWRARRLLADATAVQLTRHPDALGHAVEHLARLDVEVPGGHDVSYLFAVWSVPTIEDVERAAAGQAPARRSSPLMTMQPTRWRRLERLRAQGAHVDPEPYRPKALLGRAAMIVAVPFGLLWLALMFGATLVMMGVSLVVVLGLLAVWSAALRFAFVTLPWLLGPPSPTP